MILRTRRRFVQIRTISLGVLLLLASDFAFAQVTITEVTTPTLGTLLGGAASRNFILDTNNVVSGTDAADYLSGAQSGRLNISKSGSAQDANIVAENITTTGGITVNAVPCRWRNQTETTCDGAGITVRLRSAARPLRLGIDIDTSQVHSGGDAASTTFDITVTLI